MVGILVAVIAIVAFSAFGSNDKGTQTYDNHDAGADHHAAEGEAPRHRLRRRIPRSASFRAGSAKSSVTRGTVGTVSSNDGGVVIDSIGGSQVTILTTADTTLIALNRATIADLQPRQHRPQP